MAEGVLDMQKRGCNVEAALAQGIDWTIEDAVIDLPAEEKVQEKWCGTGKYMVTYDIDGKKYGCQMFTPIVLGKNALPADAVEWDSPESNADDYCKSCVLRNFCPTCPGFNYKYRGHLAVRDKRWCPMILAEAITACEFQVELIASMDKLDFQDAQHGKTALEAYKVLRHLDITASQSPYTI